ncbi:MAG TPA: alpha-ketoacid dehydrogenase subunit beta [Anaerolineaceae bacterium]|nr:alpha-ketoacid dehydrogenase subunit beta [Anaerolineaceae bacterium]
MNRKITFSKAINEAITQEMERDDKVFIIGEDVAKMGGDFGITTGIWERWPDRAFDTPLSEAAFIGLACGAGLCGLRPVAELMFADFIGVCYDQIVNNAAKLCYMYEGKASAQIVVRAVTGGGIRCAYHHSQCIEPWLMNIPGLVVVAPSTAYEAKGLLVSAIRSNNPVIFLEHKGLYNKKCDVPEELYEIPLYKAKVVKEGSDLTIVAAMSMVEFATKASQELAEKGVDCEVINPLTLFPMDKETIINSVAKTGRLVLIQEGPKFMGYAAEISSFINEEIFEYLKAPIKRVTSLDTPVPFAPVLEDYVLPHYEDVLNACDEVMQF